MNESSRREALRATAAAGAAVLGAAMLSESAVAQQPGGPPAAGQAAASQSPYEDIIAQIERLNLGQEAAAPRINLEQNAPIPPDLRNRICEIYRAIRPILAGILLLPFVDPRIKAAINAFMGVLDPICGIQPAARNQ